MNRLLGKDMTMNKKEKIESEELRFIYKLILEGYSDSDILNEYIHLNDIGELNFPLRNNVNFIKDKRKEMEIASEVLKDRTIEILKPFMLKQREEHFTQLAEISATLLQSNLNTVVENQREAIYRSRSKEIYGSRYIIKDSENIPIQLNTLQLINLFRKNVEAACKQYTYLVFYDYYVPHLKAEMPEMVVNGGFWPYVEKEPYEVINKIKELTKHKEFKGICTLCGDLETQIPTFISSKYNNIAQS